MPITGSGNYFEDFSLGDVYEHARGRTVTDFDNYAMTHLSMNTASVHFNLEASTQLLDGRFIERLVPGPFTLALVVGLTSEDMSENALMDVGLTGLRLTNPVFAGDTLYAKSEILELKASEDRDDVGQMTYKFTAWNQTRQTVAEGQRTVLVKRRSHWQNADDAFLRETKKG